MKTTIVAALCMTFLLSACGSKIPDDPTEREHLEAVNLVVDQCLEDSAHCVGGFVKWKKGKISRILYCQDCRNYEVGIHSFQERKMLKNAFSEIDSIIFPNDPRWDVTAVEHALQFVKDGPSSYKDLEAAS